MGFVGLNLTVPHKLLAVEMVDVLDDSAKSWGAVNTIRFAPDGNGIIRAHGFNTDAEAITRSLREDLGVELRGAKVLLLGAGGAGRVAALKLAADGVGELHLVNRTEAKAAAVADEIRTRNPGIKVDIGYPRGEVDLVLERHLAGLEARGSVTIRGGKVLPSSDAGRLRHGVSPGGNRLAPRRQGREAVAPPTASGCCCIKVRRRWKSGAANRRQWKSCGGL